MRSSTSVALGLLLLLVGPLAGCEGEDPDPASLELTAGQCLRTIDCAGGSFCEGATPDTPGVCVTLYCLGDSDCDDGGACLTHLGLCAAPWQCLVDDGSCGDEASCMVTGDDAACTDDAERSYDRCSVYPETLLLASGDARRVAVHGHAAGRVDVDRQAQLSATVGQATGDGWTATCAGPGPCEGLLTATLGDVSCTADIVILPPVPAGWFRAVVTAADGGAPIADARTVFVVDGDRLERTTDAFGVAELALASLPTAVTVLADGYAWSTTVVAAGDTAALALDRQVAPADVAGARADVDFDQAPSSGDIRIGVGGLSIGPSLGERLDTRTLFGAARTYVMDLDGVTPAGGTPVLIPDGVSFGLGQVEVKAGISALGAPRTALLWGGGQRTRLSEIGTVINALNAQSSMLPATRFFWAWLPLSGVLAHTAPLEVTPVVVPRAGVPLPAEELLVDTPTLSPLTLPTELGHIVLPVLPCRDGSALGCNDNTRLDAIFAVQTAVTPGYGAVPLGAAARRSDAGDPTDLALAAAPRHDGLERAALRTWVFATDADTHMDADAPLSAVWFAPGDGGTLTPPPLPELPIGTFDLDSSVFTIDPLQPANVFRVRLRSLDGERHDVWLPAGARTIALGDLLPDDVTARLQRVELEAISLTPDPDAEGNPFARAGVGSSALLLRLASLASVPCGVSGPCLIQ